MDKRIENLESLCDLLAKQEISQNDNIIQINQNLIREIRGLRDVIFKQNEDFIEFKLLLRKIYEMCLQNEASNQTVRNSLLINQLNSIKTPTQPQQPAAYLAQQHPYLLQSQFNKLLQTPPPSTGPIPGQQQQPPAYAHSIDRMITTPDQQNIGDFNSKLIEMARISQQINENDSKILSFMSRINEPTQSSVYPQVGPPPQPSQFNISQPPPSIPQQQTPSNIPPIQQIINFSNGKLANEPQIQKPADSIAVNKPEPSFLFGTVTNQTQFPLQTGQKDIVSTQQKPTPSVQQPVITTPTVPAASTTKPPTAQPLIKPLFSFATPKEEAKPSVFGNIIFNAGKDKLGQSEPKPAPSQPTVPVEQKPASSDKMLDFTKWNTSDTPTFADLAKGSTSTSLFGQNNKPQQPLFGQGAAVSGGLFGSFKPESIALFGSHGQKVESSKHEGEEEDEEHAAYGTHPEEYEPNVDFKPVVKLQEVEVKTGEEDEIVVFKERCKLYRFDINTKEYKEKGAGEIKILKHKINNTYRVLMRREQVHKICANHKITNDIKLESVGEKNIRWSAQDFSDNEVKLETFLARFSNEDNCKKFKNEFEAAQKQAGQSKPSAAPATTAKGGSAAQKSLAEMFNKNTWSCPGCYSNNDQSMLKCPCCETAKPGTSAASQPAGGILAASKLQPAASEQTGPKLTFGMQTTGNNQKPVFGVTQLQFGQPSKTTEQKQGDSSSKENTGLFGKFDLVSNSPKTADSNKRADDKTQSSFVNQFNGAPTNTLFGKPVFGANAVPPQSSLFGGLPVDNSLFTIKGDNKPKDEKKGESSGEQKPSIFGNVLFNTNKDKLTQDETKLFGAPKAETKNESTERKKLDFSTFNIGNSLTFADLAKNSSSNNNQPQFGLGFGAGTLGGGGGGGSLFPNFKPEEAVLFGKKQGAGKHAEDEGEEEDATGGAAHPEEYEPNVDFKPIVKLQEVEVKTGEEDEVVLFKGRCKLYRYDSTQWKEKGVGEMKILKHKTNDTHRILMRRDQVLKLCANHRITNDLKFKIAEKRVDWSAQDYSEPGAGNYEILAANFSNLDDAKRFKELTEKIQRGESLTPEPTPESVSTTSDEPIIINEVKASKEQVDKAHKYQLPDNYYLYENKEPCKGCPGCKDNNDLVNGDH